MALRIYSKTERSRKITRKAWAPNWVNGVKKKKVMARTIFCWITFLFRWWFKNWIEKTDRGQGWSNHFPVSLGKQMTFYFWKLLPRLTQTRWSSSWSGIPLGETGIRRGVKNIVWGTNASWLMVVGGKWRNEKESDDCHRCLAQNEAVWLTVKQLIETRRSPVSDNRLHVTKENELPHIGNEIKEMIFPPSHTEKWLDDY